ncbi:MAG TPA: hemerythrin domain-containing protein [Myxococcales bacterium]|nr:hemerythrin domain-containing protein [Myxococcales bacterium]HET9751571.1 hemerythrin domain-containing protein [Myxococcales bacterium]
MQVLFQHEVLRALLGRLVHASERILHGDPATQQLRDAQRTLHDVLEVHLRQEEDVLAPLLRATCGPARRDRMHADHCRVLRVLERQRARPPRQSATGSRRLALQMLAAMEAEEHELIGSAPLPEPQLRVH